MKPFLLMIAPVHADPDFARKMEIVRDLCDLQGLDCKLPSINPDLFQIEAELSIIRGASHIVADLTYGRPSCYYELGLVEASQRQASLIALSGTEIFQNAGHRPIAFFDGLEGYAQLIRDCLVR